VRGASTSAKKADFRSAARRQTDESMLAELEELGEDAQGAGGAGGDGQHAP
jgi:hypothetical protein